MDDLSTESVEVLRERLKSMKKLIAERQQQQNKDSPKSANDIFTPQPPARGIIDGSFLNIAFGSALIVIVSVSVYAFYHLYAAILKKFPSHHTEL